MHQHKRGTYSRRLVGVCYFAGLLFSFAIIFVLVNFDVSLHARAASPTTYYVDAAGGSDSNNGTDPTTAWQSVAKVNASTFLPGDTVLFKRGDTWRETLTPPSSGSTGSPITFGAYGSGDAPIITGADIVSSSWTEAAGGGAGSDVLYDNFDDGNYTGWSNTSGTVTAANKRVETSVSSTNTASLIVQDYTGRNEVWASYDFTLATSTGTSGSFIQGAGLRDTTNFSKDLYVGFTRVSGTPFFSYTYTTNSGQVQTTTNVPIVAGVTYRITIHWKKASGSATADGVIEAWAGTTTTSSLLSVSNVANGTLNNNNEMILGNNFRSGSTLTATLYFDNARVGSTGSAPVAAGSANIWTTPFAASSEPLVMTFSGNYGYKQASLYETDSQYDWMWESGNLYVHATADPSTLYTMEAAKRNFALDLNGKSYLTFDGLTFSTGNQYTAYLENNQSHNDFLNSTFQNGGLYNLVPQAASTITDILIKNSTTTRAGAGGITFTNKQRWTLDGNTSYRDGILNKKFYTLTDDLTWSQGIKMFGSLSSDNVIENNTVSYAGIRDDGYKPDTTNKGYGIWLDTATANSSGKNIVKDNTVHDNAVSGLFCEKSSYSEWDDNISYDNAQYGLRVDADDNGTVQNNAFYNNTLYGNSTNIYAAGGYAGTGNNNLNNTFKNNLAFGATTREFTAKWGAENDGTLGAGNVYLYNSFGPEAANFIEWGAGSYLSTYAAFDTAFGTSTHSTAGDPLFTNAAAADFSLQAASPDINAGTNVGLTTDFSGTTVPQGGGYDIGAYEFTETTPPTVSLSAPTGGAKVMITDPLTLTAAAADASGIAKVQFQLDGAPIGSALTAAPYTISWDTSGTAWGDHTITAVATDAYGNTTSSQAAITLEQKGGGGPVGAYGAVIVQPASPAPVSITPTTTPAALPTTATTTAAQSPTSTLPETTVLSMPEIFTKHLASTSEGAQVTALQDELKKWGYFPSYVTSTGYFWTITAQAVIALQRAWGIDPIGEVGPLTRAVLNAQLLATK